MFSGVVHGGLGVFPVPGSRLPKSQPQKCLWGHLLVSAHNHMAAGLCGHAAKDTWFGGFKGDKIVLAVAARQK